MNTPVDQHTKIVLISWLTQYVAGGVMSGSVPMHVKPSASGIGRGGIAEAASNNWAEAM